MYENNKSFIEIKCNEYIEFFKINTNERNISNNLSKINNNKLNITNNSNEINNLKQNKTFLKNLYTLLFYDNKKQISFTTDFYTKLFTVNAIKDNFLEFKFKIYLEIDNINQAQNIQFSYELLDENSNQLFKFIKKLSQYKRINNQYILININVLYFFYQ